MIERKGAAYEALVHTLVEAIRRGTPLEDYDLGFGGSNKIIGASGYAHQIDLSLLSFDRLYLFELKCLKKSVGVAEMLVLAARQYDIVEAHPSRTVLASMISLKRPSKNAWPLSRHFKIQLEIVESLESYGLSFASLHFIGHKEHASAQVLADAQVTRTVIGE